MVVVGASMDELSFFHELYSVPLMETVYFHYFYSPFCPNSFFIISAMLRMWREEREKRGRGEAYCGTASQPEIYFKTGHTYIMSSFYMLAWDIENGIITTVTLCKFNL